MPEEDELNQLLEETLDDMMLVDEEHRNALRQRSREDKWDLVQYQMKTNLQSRSVILSSVELLKHVFCCLSH